MPVSPVTPPRRAMPPGAFTTILLAVYLVVFEVWIRLSPVWSRLSAVPLCVALTLFLLRARRRGEFLSPLDVGLHLAVVLDLLVEGLAVGFHEGHGHVLCAAGFAVVLFGYRGWQWQRVGSRLAQLDSSTAGARRIPDAVSGMDESKDWEAQFLQVFRNGAEAWRNGRRTPATMFGGPDVAFLSSIGCSAQELFDFVDDFLVYGEPDAATALAVQRLRRDYFLGVQQGRPSPHRARMEDLPAKSAAVDGIAWLPRLLVKARLKLRGEMPDDLMYGCGGDRPFLRRMGTDLPEFLRWVRDAGDDDRKVIDQLKSRAGVR
jgi:hypothetical protein